MGYMKLSLCLALMITFTAASRLGEKIHFQDSSELGEFDIDERPGNGRGHRNHRGRARGHQKHEALASFEEGLPGLYPIKGPAQAPLILPSQPQHPGRGLGLRKHNTAAAQDNVALTNSNVPIQFPTHPAPNNLPVAQPQPNPYEGNPFLSKLQTPSVIPTNKYNPTVSQRVTNQLPTSDKPTTTTTPAYLNPRRTDLLYGSNLLEEEQAANREAKTVHTTEISFDDRGLFDTAPHCQSGQILVNNRCRVAV